jgi:hypothetical protein
MRLTRIWQEHARSLFTLGIYTAFIGCGFSETRKLKRPIPSARFAVFSNKETCIYHFNTYKTKNNNLHRASKPNTQEQKPS